MCEAGKRESGGKLWKVRQSHILLAEFTARALLLCPGALGLGFGHLAQNTL